MAMLENLTAFSSGGGFYHSQCKWCGQWFVVSNDPYDVLTSYADEEMNTMISSNHVSELYGNSVHIYNILLSYLKLQYPSIPYEECRKEL